MNCPHGDRHYHAVARGWIVSAVVRRVDPKKRTLGKFIREEICEPLGIPHFNGIPEQEQANYKIVDMVPQPVMNALLCDILPAKLGLAPPHILAAMAMFKNNKDSHWLIPTYDFETGKQLFCNIPELRACEIPSGGMHTNARSMAKVNACMANGGKLGNVRIMSEKACADSMGCCISKLDKNLSFATPMTQGGFGDSGKAEGAALDPVKQKAVNGFVGWEGLGGSMSFWHPEKHVAVSYVMNGMLNMGDRGTHLMCALSSIISQ